MDARDRLVNAGLVEVTLPSGVVVRGRLPKTEDLYVRDLVPDELLGVVGKFAHGATLQDLPETERPLWYRYLRLLVAAFVRDVKDEEGNWHPVALTLEDTLTMDGADVDELEYVVLRLKTPEQVTVTSRRARGEISDTDAAAIIESEAPKTIGGWASFRRFVKGAEPGVDGAGVRAAAEPDARPSRAARRSRSRRSPSVTPSS